MKIKVQQGGNTDVAFSFENYVSDSSNYTRIVRTGDIITAYLNAKSSTTIGSSTKNLLEITDKSLMPSTNVYSTGNSVGAVFRLVLVPSTGKLGAVLQTGTHDTNSWICGQISWVVGN